MKVADRIERRAQEYRAHLTDRSIDPEIQNAARAALSNVREELLESGDAEWRRDFVYRYISRERTKYQADEPDDHDLDIEADSDESPLRSKRLCTCRGRQCPLKNGKLPVEVRTADTLEAGVYEFRREHTGRPHVLDEALEERRERMAHVADVLELCNISLGHEMHVLELDDAEEVLGSDHDVPQPESA